MSQPDGLKVSWLRRSLIGALGVFIATTVLIGIVLLALGDESSFGGQLVVSSLLLVLCSGSWLAAITAMRRKWLRAFMGLSIAATLAGVGCLLVLVWWSDQMTSRDEEELGKTGASFLIIGVGLAHNGAFSLIKAMSKALLAIKIAVMASFWLGGTLVFGMMWWEKVVGNFFGSNWSGIMLFLGLVGSFLLGVVAGTIAVPIAALSRANKRIAAVESFASKLKLMLECPKCALRQELSMGNVRCGGCGAGLFIEIEEPRCECGYLLYQLQGDACPECGRKIQPGLTSSAN